MILLFSERNIEAKILYLDNINLSIKEWLLYPLAIALCLIFIHRVLFTWSSFIIDWAIDKFTDSKIKKINYKRIASDIKNRKEIRKAELEISDEYLKEEIKLEQKREKIHLAKQEEKLKLPEVKEQVFNHIDIKKLGINGWNTLSTIKENQDAPVYRFTHNDFSIYKNEYININLMTYRPIKKQEKLLLNIYNNKTNDKIEFKKTEGKIRSYQLTDYIYLELLGKYNASIQLLDQNNNIIDIANFTITINNK
jgi:hypothetical protein